MKVFVHPEARRWVPDQRDLAVIDRFYSPKLPNGSIHFWPRRLANQVLGRELPARAFRAVTLGDASHVFVDDSETKASVAFLTAHELCHQVVRSSPTLFAAFRDARPTNLRGESDEFHDLDSEEKFCDGIASRLLGTRYDRAWWRERLRHRR